jgi:serine/threonine protein kinase
MSDDSLINQQLDEYRIVSLLGQGAMARVYLGLDTHLRRYAAVKVIDTPFPTDAEHTERFEREAQAIAQLQHPRIVTLYRYGQTAERLYMAMQYVEGADLRFVLHSYQADEEYMEPDDIARIIREVCEALDYAHAKGVIHRDVKPSNILLDRTGWCYLADFGLALMVEVGTRGEVLGSPYYVAPEQVLSSAAAGPQSDLYAVGVILYEMVTNTLPFEGESPMDVAMMHVHDVPMSPRRLRPEISPQLEAVVLRAMAKIPEERFQSGAELADAVEEALRTAPVPAAEEPLAGTIPQRVALEASERSLPPLPPAALLPVEMEDSGSGHGRWLRVPLIFAVGVALGLCVAAVLLAALVWSVRGQDRQEITRQPATVVSQPSPSAGIRGTATPSPTPPPSWTGAPVLTSAAPSPSVTSTEEMPATVTPTAGATATATPTVPTPIPPSPTPVPVEGVNYSLLIAVKGGDGVFVANQGAEPFPLGPLALGDSAVQGTEWGIPLLYPDDCVVVWKDTRDEPEQPDWLACRVVGEVLIRGGKDRFWRTTFDVTYNGIEVGTCGRDQNECAISLTVGG